MLFCLDPSGVGAPRSKHIWIRPPLSRHIHLLHTKLTHLWDSTEEIIFRYRAAAEVLSHTPHSLGNTSFQTRAE